MKHESLEDIYLQMSTDELIMLITAYRHDKDNMLVSGDDVGADKAHTTIQYLRQILNSKMS
jgi:hypothetical protein